LFIVGIYWIFVESVKLYTFSSPAYICVWICQWLWYSLVLTCIYRTLWQEWSLLVNWR